MTPGYSKILIVDFVLPDVQAALLPAAMDIQMMSIGAGVERCEKEWRDLLCSIGLQITNIWHGGSKGFSGMESVIEATLPDPEVAIEVNGVIRRK
jgi:hypothetical protein